MRDVVIGMSERIDRALCPAWAGLTGAIASSHIIITAGFAEIAAGSIAMGLGGFLAARSDAEHYASERVREEQEIVAVPDMEAEGGPGNLQELWPDGRGKRYRGGSPAAAAAGLGGFHDAF